MAQVLRVAGQFDKAAEQYTILLSDRSDDFGLLSERASVLLRLKRFSEADLDIEAFRSLGRDEPWHIYLRGLSAGLSGTKNQIELACESAVKLLPSPDLDRTYHARSRFALFSLGNHDSSNAWRCYDDLIKEGHFDGLRYQAIADIDDLICILPTRADVLEVRRRLISALWPNGLGIESRANWRVEALRGLKREPYPFPMYCQLAGIGGLKDDLDLAGKVLSQVKTDERTIVLWTLGRRDRVYGQCNFKKDREAQHNLKFCDETATILSTNLGIFVKEFKVRQLMFLEDDLKQKFEKAAANKGLAASFQMATAPPELNA
jgi:hypothetical protein